MALTNDPGQDPGEHPRGEPLEVPHALAGEERAHQGVGDLLRLLVEGDGFARVAEAVANVAEVDVRDGELRIDADGLAVEALCLRPTARVPVPLAAGAPLRSPVSSTTTRRSSPTASGQRRSQGRSFA